MRMQTLRTEATERVNGEVARDVFAYVLIGGRVLVSGGCGPIRMDWTLDPDLDEGEMDAIRDEVSRKHEGAVCVDAEVNLDQDADGGWEATSINRRIQSFDAEATVNGETATVYYSDHGGVDIILEATLAPEDIAAAALAEVDADDERRQQWWESRHR